VARLFQAAGCGLESPRHIISDNVYFRLRIADFSATRNGEK
jgi:hypothetical protein